MTDAYEWQLSKPTHHATQALVWLESLERMALEHAGVYESESIRNAAAEIRRNLKEMTK